MTTRPRSLPALLMALTLLVAAPAATAQDDAALPPPRPDASHGLQLQRLVERWLAAGSIDGRRGDPLPASGVLGVRVTLRRDGHAMGTGTAWVRPERLRPRLAEAWEPAEPPAPDARPADLRALTQEAAVEAFRGAEASLREASARARADGRTPELRGDREVPELAEVADRVQAGLQIAHAAEAVRAGGPDDGSAGPAQRFVSGYHGLLALPEDARAAPSAAWPATSLAFNLRPAMQLLRVARGLDLGLVEAETLGRPGGPALFRFSVVHAVRPGRGAPVRVLERGNVPVPRSRVDGPTLSALGDRLAGHLSTHFPMDGPVRGTWNTAAGRYDPSLAGLDDAAFGAYALAAHDRSGARIAAATGRPASPRVSARVPGWLTAVAAALDTGEAEARRRIGDAAGGAVAALGPLEAGLLTLARLEGTDGEADPISRRFAAELAARCAGGRVEGRRSADGEARGVSRTTRALAGYALGVHALAAGDRAHAELAAAVLASLWADGRGGVFSAVYGLPWLGAAARDVEPGLVDLGLLEADELHRRRALLASGLPDLQEAQVVRRPEGAPGDTIGGFLLRPVPRGGFVDPTWSSAPLLQLLAQGLGGFGAGPDAVQGRVGLLITAGSAARFLAQLSLAEPSLYYARSPQNAVGGLRPSLDDSRLAIGPTASALLAVTELQLALIPPAAE